MHRCYVWLRCRLGFGDHHRDAYSPSYPVPPYAEADPLFVSNAAVHSRIQEIQEKYADDQQRQAEEMQKVYAEIGFNPITGCLPLFLQMPIFVALFQVLQEMGSRTEGMTYSFYNVLPSLALFAFRDVRPGFLGVLALRHPSSSVCILHLPALLASADGYEQPAEDADHDYDGYHVPVHAVAWLGFSYRRFVVLGNFFRIRRSAAGNLY